MGRNGATGGSRLFFAKALVPGWRAYVSSEAGAAEIKELRKPERTGRPLGSPGFVHALEALLGGPLFRKKPGLRPKRADVACMPGLVDN